MAMKCRTDNGVSALLCCRCNGIVWTPSGQLVREEGCSTERIQQKRGRLDFFLRDPRDVFIDVYQFAEGIPKCLELLAACAAVFPVSIRYGAGDSWDIDPQLHVMFGTTHDRGTRFLSMPQTACCIICTQAVSWG